VVVTMATFPARHMLDSLVLGRVGGELVFRHYQRPADGDPHTTTVGPVSVVVEEPFRRVRVVVDDADGFDAELTFTARTDAYALRRGRLRHDSGALLWDQSHMIQSGVFGGTYANGTAGGSVDGWRGQRDHSWGVRDWWLFPWCWTSGRLNDGTAFHGVRVGPADTPFLQTGYVVPTEGPIEPVASVMVDTKLGEEGLPSSALLDVGGLSLSVTAVAHAPILLESTDGRRSRFPRSLCRFEADDGRTGMGWTEWLQPQP
jgi:hypothetical protein